MYHENETKNKVLKAALKMLNQSGFGSLSISELARQAKISKQNLYYHYSSMEEVLIELAQLWSQTGQVCAIEALAASNETGAQKILAISNGMFDWMRKHQELSKLGLVLFQSGPYIRKMDLFLEKARAAARARLSDHLLRESRFQKMTPVHLNEIVTAVHSVLYGFFLYVIAMNDFENLQLHQQNCNESLNRLLQSFQESL